jgi:hypothetical protein
MHSLRNSRMVSTSPFPRVSIKYRAQTLAVIAQMQPVVLGKSRDLCFASFTVESCQAKILAKCHPLESRGA